ncbi:response regulator transcription factor [Butyricimonas sp. Marseille-P3923]|uniref:response regulator transcription factor n=1 Tax=Butyricimonas sp. Marseille-P3923 TaxID=1987504 RepID=UPI000C082664|nr:response regulator transcription factor [Butyricimonas sp. Marseille-P3923]
MENQPKNHTRVLYAEDNKRTAELLQKILELHGYSVEIAPDGITAWNAYRRERPNILLLDLELPEIDGVELTCRIREKDHATHIIIYTSHGEREHELDALDAGADEFFSKDKDAELLAHHLNNLRTRITKGIKRPHVYRLSPITSYNSASRVLTIGEKEIQLATIDARFLQLLCAKNNEIASRDYLIQGIWDKASLHKEPELKKYACRVRKALEPDPTLQIKSQDGGYILLHLER